MATPATTPLDVIRTHLEMRSLAALRPSCLPAGDVRLACENLSPDAYRALYSDVGGPWHWRDRLLLRDEQLDEYLRSPDVHVWVLRMDRATAGYFELQKYADARVEIMYFGLAAAFIGRGLGGWLLTRAVEEAFELGADHLTLHTCTLDSPAALPNYLARGFVPVREERYVERL